MKKDKEVVLAAVQQDDRVLIYATWNDKDVRKVIYERYINDEDYFLRFFSQRVPGGMEGSYNTIINKLLINDVRDVDRRVALLNEFNVGLLEMISKDDLGDLSGYLILGNQKKVLAANKTLGNVLNHFNEDALIHIGKYLDNVDKIRLLSALNKTRSQEALRKGKGLSSLNESKNAETTQAALVNANQGKEGCDAGVTMFHHHGEQKSASQKALVESGPRLPTQTSNVAL